MTAPALPIARMGAIQSFLPGYTSGLGVAVLVDLGRSELPGSVGEFNWAGAASTYFFIDPKEKLIAVLLTQYFPFTQYPLREDLKAAVYQAMEKSYE